MIADGVRDSFEPAARDEGDRRDDRQYWNYDFGLTIASAGLRRRIARARFRRRDGRCSAPSQARSEPPAAHGDLTTLSRNVVSD